MLCQSLAGWAGSTASKSKNGFPEPASFEPETRACNSFRSETHDASGVATGRSASLVHSTYEPVKSETFSKPSSFNVK
jgi:hypothetical protein